MDTCFPLLKLKHHCERQERERITRGRAARGSKCPLLASRRGDERERGAGAGPPASPAAARHGGPARRVHTWVCNQAEGGRPSSQSSPFLCSFFLSFSLLLKGDYVFAGTTRVSVLSRLLAGGSCAESPAEAQVCPRCLRPRGYAACVLRGFSFKENTVFGDFLFVF